MREVICAGLLAGAFALWAPGAVLAKPQPKSRPPPSAPAAASAETYGVKTIYRPDAGKGYTARERRMADCLATYRSYDPATDRIVVRPGVTRRCEL